MLGITSSLPRAKPTVVLVDDDEEIRDVLRLLCEYSDLEVVAEADNGVAAIPLVSQSQPDFVLLDYAMPKLDGAKTAEIVRVLAPETKIVAFSALLEGKPRWADAFLNKSRIAEVAPVLYSLIDGTSQIAV